MASNLFNLSGKTALITGGSSGIGKAIACLFVKEGAQVVIVGQNKERLQQTQCEISTTKCDYFLCDVSKVDQIDLVFSQIIKKYPIIDILVNCAGIYKENKSTYTIEENDKINLNIVQIQKLINVNLLSYWYLGLKVSTLMKKNNNGAIINISSVNGICGKAVCDIYDMTKAGINNLTLNQAMQFAKYNVRVNAICPSSTVTSMRDKAMGEYPPEIGVKEYDHLEASLIPLQRLGNPEDIASLALLLAGKSGEYITGQIISVDGGFLLTRKFPAFNSTV